MRVRDFECRDWCQAKELLRGRRSKVVCNNTVLEQSGPMIYLKLHGTPIVVFRLGFPTIYFDGGWRTYTTKQRLNRCLPSPWRLHQEKGEWRLRNYRTGDVKAWENGITMCP